MSRFQTFARSRAEALARFLWLGLRGGWEDSRAALAEGLVQDDGAGDGDVERGDAALHGDAEEEVAGALDQLVQAGAFAAEDEADVLAEVEVGVVGGAALVEADDPDVVLLHLLEGAGEIGDVGDADVLGGASGGLGDDRAERGGAAFGEKDAGDAGAVGGAEESAEVVGVFDAVEGEEEAVAGGVGGSGEEVFEREELALLALANEGDDALMHVSAGVVGEPVAWLGGDADVGGAGELGDAGEFGVAALAREDDVVDGGCAGAQRFFDGM